MPCRSIGESGREFKEARQMNTISKEERSTNEIGEIERILKNFWLDSTPPAATGKQKQLDFQNALLIKNTLENPDGWKVESEKADRRAGRRRLQAIDLPHSKLRATFRVELSQVKLTN